MSKDFEYGETWAMLLESLRELRDELRLIRLELYLYRTGEDEIRLTMTARDALDRLSGYGGSTPPPGDAA